MEGFAIAYVTCDKYAFMWAEWYKAFEKLWGVDLPCYFCGEEVAAPFFEALPHESVPAEKWTTKLKNQLEQIPEEYVFIWLDDMVQQLKIDEEFRALCNWITIYKPDALRVMYRDTKAQYIERGYIVGRPLYKLRPRSPYLISFSPNIYNKEFLIDFLDREESPWSAELEGSKRLSRRHRIYSYHIPSWVQNKVIQ